MPKGVYVRVVVKDLKGKRGLEMLIDRFAKAADGKISEDAASIVMRISARRSREGIARAQNPNGRAWAPRAQTSAEVNRTEVNKPPLFGWDGKVKDVRRSEMDFKLEIRGDDASSGGKPLAVVHQYGGKRKPRDAKTGFTFKGTGKALAKNIAAHLARGGTLRRDGWKLPARGILPKRRVPRRWSSEILKTLRKEMPKSFFVKGA